MSSFLLDTSAYSAFQRGHAEIGASVRGAERVMISPVALGELLSGFRQGKDRRANEALLERFLATPGAEVIVVDRATADCYAAIHASLRESGAMVSANDLWIAASAMQYGLWLLTTDSDFLRIPQILVEFHEPR